MLMQKMMGAAGAALLLRIGLAFVFLYAGLGALMHPEEWIGFLPSMLTDHITAGTLLKITASFELVLAAWLLSGYYVRYAAAAAALMLAGIIIGNPHALLTTFRDVGLGFAALALCMTTFDSAPKAKR